MFCAPPRTRRLGRTFNTLRMSREELAEARVQSEEKAKCAAEVKWPTAAERVEVANGDRILTNRERSPFQTGSDRFPKRSRNRMNKAIGRQQHRAKKGSAGQSYRHLL